ncbi:MAG: PaaI family thioesterase, partial [Deltaproteobacteria bacterium]|nr:PaaI family thioesterase [Deltaproteobacteria bacterium]
MTTPVNPDHYRKLERMYQLAPCNEYYKPTLAVSRARAELSLEARPDLFHSAGAVHGGTYMKLLDDVAFFAVASLVEDVFVLTVNLNTQFIRPVTEGLLTARGRVLHPGRTLFLAEAVVTDHRGKEAARAQGTFVRSNFPLSAELGYR